MPINSHASLRRLVTSRSSRDGSVFPLGCLCPTITAAAFDKIARIDEARVQTPDMADVDGDGLILRVEADDEEVFTVKPIQEFFHECIALIPVCG